MSVFRIEKTKDYTVMANHHLRNRNLSLKAKGLLTLMLSLPEEWDYSLGGLAHISREGVDAIREGVRELEAEGYIIRKRTRSSNGQLGRAEYVIYEQPLSENPTQADNLPPSPSQEPTLAAPMLEIPIQVEAALENQIQLNTNVLKTYLENKEQSNIHPSYPPQMDVDRCRRAIRQQIEYHALTPEIGKSDTLLDEIVELMLEVQCTTSPTMQIAGSDYSTKFVKERFASMHAHHIDYVRSSFKNNTTKVRNIKKYLLTALFNAPTTMDHQAMAEVNYDLFGGALRH
jgi:hypothetical protein